MFSVTIASVKTVKLSDDLDESRGAFGDGGMSFAAVLTGMALPSRCALANTFNKHNPFRTKPTSISFWHEMSAGL